eukprot:scaffold72457_cov51-Phaeocystis_antarctica.AAC.1
MEVGQAAQVGEGKGGRCVRKHVPCLHMHAHAHAHGWHLRRADDRLQAVSCNGHIGRYRGHVQEARVAAPGVALARALAELYRRVRVARGWHGVVHVPEVGPVAGVEAHCAAHERRALLEAEGAAQVEHRRALRGAHLEVGGGRRDGERGAGSVDHRDDEGPRVGPGARVVGAE